MEVSALTGDGIVDGFDKLCELIFEYEEVKRTAAKTLEKQKSKTDATQKNTSASHSRSGKDSRSKKEKGKKDGHCSIC